MRVAALDAQLNLKRINSETKKQALLSGEQDSLGRGERPPVLGTGYLKLGGWVSDS